MSDPDPAVALSWLGYSTEDHDVTRVLLIRSLLVPRHFCRLAQQTAEKVVKDALVLGGVAFPFTHDPDALRNRLPENWLVHTNHSDLAELTQCEMETRYQGDCPVVAREYTTRAESEAASLHDSVAAEFERRDLLPDAW